MDIYNTKSMEDRVYDGFLKMAASMAEGRTVNKQHFHELCKASGIILKQKQLRMTGQAFAFAIQKANHLNKGLECKLLPKA